MDFPSVKLFIKQLKSCVPHDVGKKIPDWSCQWNGQELTFSLTWIQGIVEQTFDHGDTLELNDKTGTIRIKGCNKIPFQSTKVVADKEYNEKILRDFSNQYLGRIIHQSAKSMHPDLNVMADLSLQYLQLDVQYTLVPKERTEIIEGQQMTFTGQYLLVIGQPMKEDGCLVIRAIKIQNLSPNSALEKMWPFEVMDQMMYLTNNSRSSHVEHVVTSHLDVIH